MSAVTALPFAEQPAPGKGASILLALAVHLLLLAFLFCGIRWQTQKPAAIEVELVTAPPPSIAAVPPEPELHPEPLAEAKPEPPPVEVAPPPPKPAIAIKEKANPAAPKIVPKPPRDLNQKKLLEQEFRQTEERKNAALANAAAAEELSKLGKQKAAQDAEVRSKAIASYIEAIRRRIKNNIVLPIDIKGNPEAVFDVVQLPGGEILSVKLKKSSGHAGYDAAVERAINKSSPLPRPAQDGLFSRELELKFRPQED